MATKKKTIELRPWQKGGPSPNPKGRKRGVPDRRGLASKKLLDSIGKISDKVIDAALEGDLNAAGLIFGRVLPALSPQAEKVEFDLDPAAPLATQVEQVLSAMATGKISADVAKQIIETIGSLGAIRQMDEIENRIAVLEAVA